MSLLLQQKKNMGRLLLFVLLCWTQLLNAQSKPLDYYLPKTTYDQNVPTPEAFLGYQIGDWHISHDQLVFYLKAVAAASPRVQYQEIGRTHEERPLIHLIITSEANQAKLEAIRQAHLKRLDPDHSQKSSVKEMPVVVYQGYSVHGNESSAANSAVLMAYHLAAGQSKEVQDFLDHAVIILDPCMNPDGHHRFSTWANSHKSYTLVPDGNAREFDEVWPGGRTNHYWFDLNRDWLPAQHPESQARLKVFHEWKPNVLADHHEMGQNATYFFQPGIPTRTNPITPVKNQDLTREIAKYHAKALDDIGSLYYSEESFDDFYYGKGSTYPDANGCIGILFEQASARGHLRETDNGLMSFPFTIRNQVQTSLSTLRGGVALREELLNYQADFFKNAQKEGKSSLVKGYQVSSSDKGKLHAFLQLLLRHQIEVYRDNQAYIIPSNQSQYRLIRAMFETTDTFKDSLFYDVSAWTLPLAFGLEYSEVSKLPSLSQKDKLVSVPEMEKSKLAPTSYAYALEWDEYFAPAALYQIQQAGLRTKVAMGTLNAQTTEGPKPFNLGTILIPIQNQVMNKEEIQTKLQTLVDQYGVEIHAIPTGLTSSGIDLGSPNMRLLKMPEVLVLGGASTRSYDVGEVWHLLDRRFGIPVVVAEANDLSRMNLNRYTDIVLADGNYRAVSKAGIDNLRSWLKEGGNLILMRGAINWANTHKLTEVNIKKSPKANATSKTPSDRRPYAKASADRGAQLIGGAIAEIELDLTHPLTYGYSTETIPVFRRGTSFYEPAQNAYATPGRYTKDALLSGYMSQKNQEKLKQSAAIIVCSSGRGRVINLVDNPNFRAFWYGTNRLFLNAIFFGDVISGSTTQGVE